MSKAADENDGYYKTQPSSIKTLFEPVAISPWDAHNPHAVTIVESLLAHNYAVVDQLMDPAEARKLREEIAKLYHDGRMVDGQIGTNAEGNSGEVRVDMRTDKMVWMEGSESFVGPLLRRHILRSDVLSQKINLLLKAIAPEHAWQGCGRSKIMATCYPRGGKRYVAHYDNPNHNGRKLTMILYLNGAWKHGDGGVLRMKSKGVQVDVAPLENRLLCFWSDKRCPHEVLPTSGSSDRFAITIWYLDEDDKLKLDST